MIAMADASAASLPAWSSRRKGTMSVSGGTPVRSRIRWKSICSGKVKVPSMSKTTPFNASGSTNWHRNETSGSSMTRLHSMSLSSGGTRFPPIVLAESTETVLLITACNTAPAFSRAAGASSVWNWVHASIMAAVKSPVPVKGPPAMRGSRNNHLRRPTSESIIATNSPSLVASGTSSVVSTIVGGPRLCNLSQAAAASATLPILICVRSSASNWFGVRTDTLGNTSVL
mmetsp:Transcript_117572/g.262870  ORF Transcript_117572/g.262870 Transcript_117572/m.262870 type:complete len:229 (-) Transcript_117572:343-1029(-)